jgi:hypothetical protein
MFVRFARNYIQRHRNRANQLFHLVGLPVTFVLPVVFLLRHEWRLALACFVGGYLLQFVGHAFEGNDAGETILVKKLLGRPYVEFGPPANESKNS